MGRFSDRNEIIFYDFNSNLLNEIFIQQHAAEILTTDISGYNIIQPDSISINAAAFSEVGSTDSQSVEIVRNGSVLALYCSCSSIESKLCIHQAQVLYNISQRTELRIFFDEKLRSEKIRQQAIAFGLENEPDPDNHFLVGYSNKKNTISPKTAGLFPVTKETTESLQEQLFLKQNETQLPTLSDPGKTQTIVVLRQHRYYGHLCIDIFEAATTLDGKIKNPLTPVSPLDYIWKSENSIAIKFFTAISTFQNNFTTAKSPTDIKALKAILKNPLKLAVYYHDSSLSENISPASVVPVSLKTLPDTLSIAVDENQNFYRISGKVGTGKEELNLSELTIRFSYFFLSANTLYFISNFHSLRLIEYFAQKKTDIIIHRSGFEAFRNAILNELEGKIKVNYSFVPPATAKEIEATGLNVPMEKLIYLSDLDNYVLINPVAKYGDVEIPVLSKKQVHILNEKGKPILFQRDDAAEINFTALLLKQHPDFMEQLDNDLLHFYLHKERFLNEEWFPDAFEEWAQHGITILGFNELKGNRINPHKAKITLNVTSGIDWFNTDINVMFGKRRATLKQLHKSVRNKSKYVQLDDGTLGLLPAEWIEKFSAYFYSGQVIGEQLQTPRINYASVAKLYEAEMLDEHVKEELKLYQSKFSSFDSIQEVEVPAALNGELRHYQREGLNWLNFLDDFNFGGCLADDMGLGKSIQIIAFILSQRGKVQHNTNLIVVPTSLIFNWQAEVNKFAPDLKICTIYGTSRIGNSSELDQYEIVLTSYGTMISDLNLLKSYRFNYIFLDESQHIKNPESQRYQAVRLLQSRNKIAITGTPIENNTFDLYGQLSFACPGLLGNKQYFKDIYSVPIDKFRNTQRAIELQERINPFILRRTKQQVARELPEKTEMVIRCEMGPEQRKVYEIYEKEIRDYLTNAPEDGLPKSTMHVLKGLTKLRQICNSPLLLPDDKLHGDASAKIEMLIEQIESKSPQHKILVFSQFVSMLDLIRNELAARNIRFEYLTGATKNREAAVNNFQEQEEIRVFLISLKAGGTGLNLTRADYVYLVDPWWNPAVENQAIDRCYRIGQEKNVVAIRLICPGTIEEKIIQLQETKKELVHDLIKTDTAILKSLSKSNLLALLS